MQAKPGHPNPPARTFTESARRAQIVGAAIETIAEVGFARASFALIARRAGLSSTGLISYHFTDKDELIQEVVAEIVGKIGRFMSERMQAPTSSREALRSYIEGNVEFIGAHRADMKTLLDVFLNGGFHYDAATERAVISPLQALLRAGQRTGEFRDFDAQVMSTLVQRAVDGLPFLLAAEPDLDTRSYAREVFTAFDLATRTQR